MSYFGRKKLGMGFIVVYKVLNYLWDCLLSLKYNFQGLGVGWEVK